MNDANEPAESDAVARRAAKRKRDDARARELRAERRAAGLCFRCGKPLEPGREPGAASCAECLVAHRDRQRRYEDGVRAANAAAEEEPAPSPSPRLCPHCGSDDLHPDGRHPGTRRYKYRCHACGRNSSGDAPLPTRTRAHADHGSCPHCGGGPCVKAGHQKNTGRQIYRCRACGRQNTERRADPRRSPHGPCRHLVTFYPGLGEIRNLRAYCAATGLSSGQAIREMLRPLARPLGITSSRREYDAWGDPVVVIRRPTPVHAPLRYTEATLPDLRPESMRSRMREKYDQELIDWPIPVAVMATVSVRLDDLAWEALLRLSSERGSTHQEVVRHLIRTARPPAAPAAAPLLARGRAASG